MPQVASPPRKSVALVGGFCAGKTTLADLLGSRYGYAPISLAGRLKQLANSVYGVDEPISKTGSYEVTDLRTGQTKLVSGRVVLQTLGQGIKAFDRDFWLKFLDNDLRWGCYGQGPWVIDDCRFPYEAVFLRRRDFIIVKLDTPEPIRLDRYQTFYGRLPTKQERTHPSETEVENIEPDFVIPGDQTPEDILEQVIAILQ